MVLGSFVVYFIVAIIFYLNIQNELNIANKSHYLVQEMRSLEKFQSIEKGSNFKASDQIRRPLLKTKDETLFLDPLPHLEVKGSKWLTSLCQFCRLCQNADPSLGWTMWCLKKTNEKETVRMNAFRIEHAENVYCF